MKRLICCVCLVLIGGSALIGQLVGNYWNLNYGTKAQLLNGAVIAGVDDNSALIYNPAAIGTDTVGGFTLSLLSPSYSVINTNSAQLNNLSITDLDLLPNLAVVDFPFFQNSKIKSSLGIFSKRSFDLDFATQLDVNFTPTQTFVGSANYRNKISENFFGFGISYQLSDDFQMGLTQGINIRSQTQTFLISGRSSNFTTIFQNQDSFTSFSDFSYTYPSMNTKFGFLLHRLKYSIGLTITTPQYFHLFDSGRYQIIDPQFVDGEFVDNLEETQDGLGSTYKFPWSFGLGGEFQVNQQGKLYGSAEVFTRIRPYTIINNPNSKSSFNLNDGSRQVANVALGFEQTMSESFTLLCGLRTDFNSVDDFDLGDNGDRRLFRFAWNVYHATAGGLFSVKSFRFSAGLGYAFSKNNQDVFNPFQQVFQSFGINDFELETDQSTYHSITVFFNYSLLFKRIVEKTESNI